MGPVPCPAPIPVAFRALHASPLVGIRDYDCHASRGGPGAEEYSEAHSVVLMRHGAFCRHFGRRSVTADVNQAAFFAGGSTYRVSHPVDCGDRGTVFHLPQRVLNDILRELDPSIDDHPDHPFAFQAGPCASDLFWRHRELVRRLERAASNPIEPFWVEVTALQLVADALEAGFEARGRPRTARKRGTGADHAELAEAAKAQLSARLGESLTLDDVARSVYASPFHLARIFQEHTGLPIHRYLTLLRLRASLERLAAGPEALTALALDLGFSSHSHFTDAFRREFGCTPSDVRRDATSNSLREMRKNLEV